MNNKQKYIIIAATISLVLIVGMVTATHYMDGYTKTKELKEIDCNKKYDPEKCKDKEKIKIKDDIGLVFNILENTEGLEVIEVYAK